MIIQYEIDAFQQKSDLAFYSFCCERFDAKSIAEHRSLTKPNWFVHNAFGTHCMLTYLIHEIISLADQN